MPKIHDENEVLRDVLFGLQDEVPPMPEGLHAAWMQQVEEDAASRRKPQTPAWKSRQFTRFLGVAAALVFVIGGTLLTRDELGMDSLLLRGARDSLPRTTSASDPNVYQYSSRAMAADDVDGALPEVAMIVAEDAAYDAGGGTGAAMKSRAMPADEEAAAEVEKKIIRTVEMTIATASYQDSVASARNSCEALGGWVQTSRETVSSASGLSRASLTLRIPQSALDDFLIGAEGLGRITARSETARDVTAAYQDTSARLATQEALMARLQALITESGDLTDLLALESQIADTQYEIDALRSSLANTDGQVTYATVTLTINEEETPSLTDATVSLGDRLKAGLATGWSALTGFCNDMAVFLMAALPFIGVFAVLFLLGRIVLNHKRRSK